ncbi:hypothetical protein [Xanthomonas campestris]|uniref:hypothetical protein n=1 Tax=Xanthomonas campestris TaxID=339 RepID=UPI0023670A0F|nr:hypothetical protein [Xanthomonas campestris]MEA9709299.1 hypothetical protein [Xanthomonas campestris]MEA9782933.1 hypothetical protein [Xanthomonas campestris pv. raphani]MEA9791061.1 hypothetical protein [Xanthomonas campestris pv. raphani]MEA9803375.1 hypothetical protein [Xanthomonas campestris pv. raphani]MEA9818973.1 hypothetical protein [Xanthomonas campestris pv. raphani]
MRALIATQRSYRALGTRFKQILADNGACYRSALLARAMRRLGLKHRRTRPYTPALTARPKLFIQTSLRESAYACSYGEYNQRAAYLI